VRRIDDQLEELEASTLLSQPRGNEAMNDWMTRWKEFSQKMNLIHQELDNLKRELTDEYKRTFQ
jgi:hypothetical protein